MYTVYIIKLGFSIFEFLNNPFKSLYNNHFKILISWNHSSHSLSNISECYLDKEGLFFYINILPDRCYRVRKTQANVLGENESERNEMKLPKFEFIQPHSLQEACSILGEHDRKALILAGGTALMVGLRYRLSKPGVVIGLKGLTTLDYLRRNGSGGLAIGSMVTLETLEKSPLVLNEYTSLAQAVQLVAIPPIRHKATIGGNLCLDTRCIYYNQSEFWRSAPGGLLQAGRRDLPRSREGPALPGGLPG